MSIIGSSPAIGSGSTLEMSAVRGVGSSDRSPVQQSSVPAAIAAVVTSTALDAGAVPVDQARVASIRKALETNSYPLNPARISDAMIAAGMLLRMPK